MGSIRLISEADVRRLLDIDRMLDVLADGFRALSDGKVQAPPRNGVNVPGGFLLSMPGYMADQGISVKLVAGFHDNHKIGLPGHQAIICLFDSATGSPLAMMDGTAITALRTAGGAALATRLLAREDAKTLAIIGAGAQGQSHLQVVTRVREIAEIRIASYYYSDAQKLASQDPRATAFESFEEAVRGADIVCLCTSSETPVIELDWLSKGAHVTSVGFAPPGGELPRSVAEAGSLYVESEMAFAPAPAGCSDLAGMTSADGAELGEVLLGRKPGRQTPDEITVYKAMGHAMEDLVAARLVYDLAVASNAGSTFDLHGA